MQIARSEAGEEPAWIRHNWEIVVSQLREAGFISRATQ